MESINKTPEIPIETTTGAPEEVWCALKNATDHQGAHLESQVIKNNDFLDKMGLLEDKFKKFLKDKKELATKLKEVTATNERLVKEVERQAKLPAENRRLTERVKELEKNKTTSEKKIKDLDAQVKDMQKKLQNEQNKSEGLNKQVDQLKKESAGLTLLMEEANKKFEQEKLNLVQEFNSKELALEARWRDEQLKRDQKHSEELQQSRAALNKNIDDLSKNQTEMLKEFKKEEDERIRAHHAEQQGRDKECQRKLDECKKGQFEEQLKRQNDLNGERFKRLMDSMTENREKREAASTSGEQLQRLVETERDKLVGKFAPRGAGPYADGSTFAIGQQPMANPVVGYLN